MVNTTKVEPKTVQGILRHSRIQTTLDLYTQQDSHQTLAAHGQFLVALLTHTAMGQSMQVEMWVDFFGCKGRKL
jgi:hypothetical protein